MDPLIVVFGFGGGILVGTTGKAGAAIPPAVIAGVPALLGGLAWGPHTWRSRAPRSPRRPPVPSEASS